MLSSDIFKSLSYNQKQVFPYIDAGTAKVTMANSQAGARFFGREFQVGKQIDIVSDISLYTNAPQGMVRRAYQ